MKQREISTISKYAHELIELAKMSTLQNLTNAVASGQIKVDRTQLPVLVQLIQQSMEEGFSSGLSEFERQVTEVASSKKK